MICHGFSARCLRPTGWLRRQLRIQADGLAGNLDRVWPDVRDSRWIGGDREGWERAPYWLDGFIPLAWLLEDGELQQRARHYVEAILERQQPDGWICPCAEGERAAYDIWVVLLLGKVLMLYFDCTGELRVRAAVARAFRQLNGHLDRHPLFDWGRYRWFEGLITLAELRRTGPEEPWMAELAGKLHTQGMDYEQLARERRAAFTEPTEKWNLDTHVVNLAMALKAGPLYAAFDPAGRAGAADELFRLLREHHGMACGHFTGDECLAGCSPIQGSELCGVVEAMYSCEVNFAHTGSVRWLDRLARLAFNALPAATTPDMWAHQYVQQTNQIGCVTETRRNWTTNNEEAHLFGLEPHFGCCTANFGQGWPKLALAGFFHAGREIIAAGHLPMRLETEIDGVRVRIECESDYPFRDRLVYLVRCDAPVEFTFGIAVPGFAEAAQVDGRPAAPESIHRLTGRWEGTRRIAVAFDFAVRYTPRPDRRYCLWRGPLLFALPVASRPWERREYVRDGVERRFPWCDYEIAPAGAWNYGFSGGEFSVARHPVGKIPFDPAGPPVILRGSFRPLDWPLREGFRAIAAPQPVSTRPTGPEITLEMIPYGCTMLRMTEMPVADGSADDFSNRNIGGAI